MVGAAVLALAIFGTHHAVQRGRRGDARPRRPRYRGTTGGTGEGSTLEVQVIAQQWAFTYRYPSFGGFESAQLVLPVGTNVTLHVTSLDVVHSFWYPAIGVKADAVPEHDNIFNTTTQMLGTYRIVCGELCGLWHGSMSDNNARVVSCRRLPGVGAAAAAAGRADHEVPAAVRLHLRAQPRSLRELMVVAQMTATEGGA